VEGRLRGLLEGHEGIFQAQFAGGYLLDLNPRVYGSMPLAVAAGANLPGIYSDLLRGSDEPAPPIRARPGVRFRWIEGDVRHLAWAVRRREMTMGQAVEALRPRRRTAHSTESLGDPLPMLVRLRYAASRGGDGGPKP